MHFDRIVEILGLWPHYVVAGLAVPIVVGVLARKVVLTLFSALLSLLSLTLLFDPSSIGPALVVEPQQVVPGYAESADGRFGADTAMGAVPVVAVQPDRKLCAAMI